MHTVFSACHNNVIGIQTSVDTKNTIGYVQNIYINVLSCKKSKWPPNVQNSCLFVLSTLSRLDVAGGKVSPRGDYKPLLFFHCWTTQGPESNC